MKAIGYIRTSTKHQASSLETQRWLLERWAKDRGYELLESHQDFGVSGVVLPFQRKGLAQALESVSAHRAGILVACYPDRFSRDILVSHLLEREVLTRGAMLWTLEGPQPRRILDLEIAQFWEQARTMKARGRRPHRGQPQPPKTAILFCRTGPKDKAGGLRRQISRLRHWCLDNNISILGEFLEVNAATQAPIQRPTLSKALETLIEHKGDLLLATDRSRLGRKKEVIWALEEFLEKNQSKMITLDNPQGTDPWSELGRHIQDSIDEHVWVTGKFPAFDFENGHS